MAHTHSVIDADKHFVIDSVTRAITNQSEKLALIQGDHNSEQFTFEIPKTVDGHDMTLCNKVEVHYLNVSLADRTTTEGLYLVSDLKAEDDTVTFSWLISGNATKYAGKLSFVVKFKCVTDGVIDYVWNTAIFEGISISNGINNTDAVVEEYADILAEWENRITALEKGGTGGYSARISEVTLTSDGWQGANSPYSQVVDIEGITPYSQVDLTPSIEQLSIFYQKDLAFVTENENGIVTVYALGDKPQNDYTMQVTITEVSV
jgi:hypothetical protein